MNVEKYIAFILLCIAGLQGYSQIAVQNEADRVIVYKGVSNRLRIAVEDCPKGVISWTTDNGTITGEDGFYEITPDHIGLAHITGKKKTEKQAKVLGEMTLAVKELPNPTPYFARKTGGNISAAEARLQIALAAVGGSSYGCANFKIDGFTFIVIRNNQAVLLRNLHNDRGCRFTDDDSTREFMKTLKDGDRLLFSGITCKGPDGISRNLNPMEFTLTNKTGESR